MKICRILYTYSPYPLGGADIYAEKIHKEIVKITKERSVVITINPKKGDVVDDYPEGRIYRLHPFNISTHHAIGKESIIKQCIWSILDLYSFNLYKKIIKILKLEKPDIVHIHTPIDVSLSAINAVKKIGLPLVYTLHDYFLLCRKITLLHSSGKICTNNNINQLCRIYRKFTQLITHGKIDIVIAPSQFVLDMHIRYGFFKNTRVVVLPHGIDLEGFEKVKERKSYKDNKSDINMLSTSALIQQKGVHILIKAFRQIKEKNIKLHIVNSGARENLLKNLAKNDNRIIFYGKLSNQKLQDFYKVADITIVPSIWHDVRPNVIVESFRAGVPVIASKIGGIPELVKDGYNGYLFEPGDVTQLKLLLEQVIKNPQHLEELGVNARKFVQQFEMSKYIQQLHRIYNDLLVEKKNDK